MRIVISGYGKMGSLIEERAAGRGHTITAIVDPLYNGSPKSGAPLYRGIAELPAGAVSNAVLIDFTHPSVAFDNISAAAARKLPLVVGTTGWYDRLDEVRAKVSAGETALFYAANFSLGVHLFYKIAAYAAGLIDGCDDYDAGGFEAHHNRKADSPSGTAKTLAGILLDTMTRKKRAVFDKLDRPPEKDELHIASVRLGHIPGTHTVYFDSPADTIEITHTARNRDGLVSGALYAAEWLMARVESGGHGVFTLEDLFA